MFTLPKKREKRVTGRTTEVIRVRNSTLEYRAVRYAYNDLEWEEE